MRASPKIIVLFFVCRILGKYFHLFIHGNMVQFWYKVEYGNTLSSPGEIPPLPRWHWAGVSGFQGGICFRWKRVGKQLDSNDNSQPRVQE